MKEKMSNIKLHKKLFTTITFQLFIAVASINSYAQIDMNALGGLAQSLNNNVSDERAQGTESDLLGDEDNNKLNKKSGLLNNADDFGYQGQTDFVSLHLKNIRFSKTDPTGKGRPVFIPFKNDDYCPVSTLKLWLDTDRDRDSSSFNNIKLQKVFFSLQP